MKMNLKKLGDQAIEATTTATKMRLSEDASSMVFQLFTKNVYSNPIGTVVREITSNCFDSHTEAGVNKPVVIRKHKDDQTKTNYISFIDFGVGMSPDRIQNIYGVYFESTKRVDNTQIGGFGIGGKTPLAYKRSTGQGEGEYDNSFYVVTIFDGIKYFYMIAEGEECPVIHKLHEEPTEEGNGTEVQIPVLEKDIGDFEREMTKQLYYFENIVFEGFNKKDYHGNLILDDAGNTQSSMSNDYQIIRAKNFLFRGDNYDDTMHVCLGRVAYPIDYSTLGLSSHDYGLPIALKLEVGDVNVTVSRESIDYSEATIKMLKKKLEAAKDEIKKLIGKQYKDIKTLEQYFSVKNDFGKLKFPNGSTVYVGNLIEQKDVDFSNFKYQFMKMPNDKQLFKFFFDTRQLGKKPSRSRYSSSSSFDGGYKSLRNNDNVVYVEDEWKRKVVKQAWLKDKYTTYFLIGKRKVDDRSMRSEIADLFNVHLDETVDDYGKPVEFVQELLDMQEEYMDIVRENCENYDEIEVPEEFVASRKRGSGITPELRKQSIPVKFVGGYSKDRVMLSTLFDYNMPIFYGTQDDQYALRDAQSLYELLFDREGVVSHCDYNSKLVTGRNYHSNNNTKNSIAFVQLAQNNVKYMAYCKKAYHVSEFKVRMAYRKEDAVRQYIQTRGMIDKYEELGRFYRNAYVDRVSDDWGEKMEVIRTYLKSIPKDAKNERLMYQKDHLKRYYGLEDVEQTDEQKDVMLKIGEILNVQDKNDTTLNFFQLPREASELTDEQITILQVSLAL